MAAWLLVFPVMLGALLVAAALYDDRYGFYEDE